jgi:hypothetical protein
MSMAVNSTYAHGCLNKNGQGGIDSSRPSIRGTGGRRL